MPKRTASQTACVGRVVTSPVGDAVVKGDGNRNQSGGRGQYNGTGGTGDPKAVTFAKQNNVTGAPKNV